MKAIVPAAGLGTRFLPATKNTPKEMLPLVDKPVIQYVVEEAVDSGLDEILVITRDRKGAIADHFDRTLELERHLEEAGKTERLEEVRRIGDLADIHFVRQKKPRGLGHAILQARTYVGDEPFAVLLGDDIVMARGTPCTRQLVERHEDHGGHVVAVEPISAEQTHAYGVPAVNGRSGPHLRNVVDLVEKPGPERAPSHLGVLGRYVLEPEVFDVLEELPPGRGGELQLTDALRTIATQGPSDVFAYEIQGTRYDLGNKVDWLKTNIEVALMREETREPIHRFIQDLMQDHVLELEQGLVR